MRKAFYKRIARLISGMTVYYDRVIQFGRLSTDNGLLYGFIECPQKGGLIEGSERTALLLNGNLNFSCDIEEDLKHIKTQLNRRCRVLAVLYNPYLGFIFRLLNALGFRKGPVPTTFITRVDLYNFAKLSGYEVVKLVPSGLIPFECLGLGTVLEKILLLFPGFKHICFMSLAVLRPVLEEKVRPSVSLIVPARNERGNIEKLVTRLPDLRCPMEVIFVEGHSTDGTWQEIQRVLSQERLLSFQVKALQQEGKGKRDAVALGISQATHDLILILDADLTVPPESLDRFYDCYCSGKADFVNGSRLVYPFPKEAMRFLNRIGNIFFAKFVSHVLEVSIGDSLCGTKLFPRLDCERFSFWRKNYHLNDPFGDFDLLFSAASLGLGITDVPVPYQARTYGSTNIHRFRDGWLLFKMTLSGFFKIRLLPN